MRRLVAILAVSVQRLVRDRSNIFFVFVFPMALILVIGLQFGGGTTPHLGVVVPSAAGELALDLVDTLEADGSVTVDHYRDEGAVSEAVARGTVRAGLVVPPDYDTRLATGAPVDLGYVARQDGSGLELQATVEAAVAEQATAVRAARYAADEGLLAFEPALDRVRLVAAAVPGVDVRVSRVGTSRFTEFEGLGQFDLGAGQELLLFVFLTSLAGSAALIQTRQLGIADRMLSTPTSPGAILGGLAAGRFAVAVVQGVYIMVGSLLLFGVDWGDPLGATTIMLLFSAVSAGAAMLMGALFSNDEQAGGMGVFIGLALAALGGCMAPLELFSPTMQRIAHVTPHAWALDGFAELVRRDGTVLDILPEVGVLALFAAVLLTVATWRLHRVTVRA